ncbi:protein LAZ1 [Tanacetum coccineum]
MENVTEKRPYSYVLYLLPRIKNIDGKLMGKDGKPMRTATRNVHFHNDKDESLVHEASFDLVQAVDSRSVSDSATHDGSSQDKPTENPNFVSLNTSSFADVLNSNKESRKSKFRALLNPEQVANADFVLPLTMLTKVKKDEDDFFFFKFASLAGLEQVLEQGPWLICNIPMILTKWSPNLSLTKDKVTKVPVWVKLHKVPVIAYSEDGLSLIATQIGQPVMLDAFTSTICGDPWGRMGYTRALIEVSADKELKQEVIMVVPEVVDTAKVDPVDEGNDGFTMVSRKIEDVKINKIRSTFIYRPKVSEPARTMEIEKENIDLFKLKYQFDSLRTQDDTIVETKVGESSMMNEVTAKRDTDSESEVEEIEVCYKVFRSWDWTSNANLCSKGYRIILGWNLDIVNVVVVSQSSQVMHVKIVHKAFGKQLFCSYALFQPYRISDHSPAVLHIPNLPFSKPKPFKIFNFLTHKSQFKEVVSNAWNKDVKGHKIVELDTVQKALDLNPNDVNLRDEEAVYVQAFVEAKLDEERFLKQKAKIEWLDVGDSNSTYFHKSIKCRNHRSRVDTILNSANVEVTGTDVANAFVSHYENFLGSDMVNVDGLLCKRGFERTLIPIWLSSNTDDEIKLLKEINHTFLALIPKVPTPLKVTNFRPISCCNVIYKCISKILTNRIINGVKEVVSDNQSAFVPGRRISDNILIISTGRIGPPRWCLKIETSRRHMTRLNGDIHGFFKGKRGLRQGDPLSPYLLHSHEGYPYDLTAAYPLIFACRECGISYCRVSMDALQEDLKSSILGRFRAFLKVPLSFEMCRIIPSLLSSTLCHFLKDKVRQWDVGVNTDLTLLRCPLCNTQQNSHARLVFECVYSAQVWKLVRHLAAMEMIQPILQDIIAHLQPMAHKRTTRSIIGKLI